MIFARKRRNKNKLLLFFYTAGHLHVGPADSGPHRTARQGQGNGEDDDGDGGTRCRRGLRQNQRQHSTPLFTANSTSYKTLGWSDKTELVGDNGGTAARFDGEHAGLSDGEPNRLVHHVQSHEAKLFPPNRGRIRVPARLGHARLLGGKSAAVALPRSEMR